MLQAGAVALVVVVTFALVARLLDRELSEQYEQRALAVAHVVAADPLVIDAAERGKADPQLQARAEWIQQSTGALFIVVTDRHGVRLTHPNLEQVGKLVSTDASTVLAGAEVTNMGRGTLGISARGKTPLRNASGQVVGMVSVGFEAGSVRDRVVESLLLMVPYAGSVLLLGIVASILFTRRLGRLTLGLEPEQMAALIRDREAVLRGVGEGVLAFDANARVSVCNGEAGRLLNRIVIPGTPIAELDLPSRLNSVLRANRSTSNLVTVVGDRVLVANHRQVRHGGRDLGGVLTLRDRTELEMLARELDAVKAVTNALRAQRHEFANRIHTVAGLLHHEHYVEAANYLQTVSVDTATSIDGIYESIHDPYLQAFFAVKSAEAAEKGVLLRIEPDCSVPGRLAAPVTVTTVVGNVVDNAVDAALAGRHRPAFVDASLIADGGALVVQVADSGDGVSPEIRAHLFVEGVSTRGNNRGLGLALAQQAARSLGGSIEVASTGAAGHGAVFVAFLPGVVEQDTGGGRADAAALSSGP